MRHAAATAFAAWPADQPIKIIVPQAPGGTNDTVARVIGQELAKALQQTVVVENRAGAAGAIVKAVSDALVSALATEPVRQRLLDSGIEPRPLAHQDFDRFLRQYIDTWDSVLPGLKLKLD